MKKRILATMIAVLSVMSLVACGNDTGSDVEPSVESSVEATEVPSNEVEPTEEPVVSEDMTIVFEDEFAKVEHSTDKVVLTLDATSYTWVADAYEEGIVSVENIMDETSSTYNFVPLDAGIVYLNMLGNNDTDSMTYYFEFTVSEEKMIDVIVSTEPIEQDADVQEPEVITPEVPLVDEALNAIISSTYEKLGEDNYPPSVASRDLEVTNVDDVSYILGVETLTGLEKAVVSEPLMSSIAFSYVVLQFDTNDNAIAAADTLLTSAPTGKWVCVEPEKVLTRVVNDNQVLFFMGPVATADLIETMEF